MSRKSSQQLYLPGEVDWEYRERGRVSNAWPSGPFACCLESRSLNVVPLWVGSTEPDRIEQIVQMQLEGGQPSVSGGPFDCRPVSQDDTRTQVMAVVLAEEPADLPGTPEAFAAMPQLYRLPPDHLVLWRERSRWVCVFTRNDKPAFFQALSGRDLDGDLLVEVRCIREMLEANEFAGPLRGIRIWDSATETEDAEVLGAGLDLPVLVEARPEPVFPRDELRLLPESVARQRVARQRRSQSGRWMLAGAAIYLLVAGFFAYDLFRRDRENRETAAWIAENEPEAARVRESKLAWQRLAPAVDVDRYPLELFHRLVELLPEEGIRLTHFEADLDTIVIKGEASSSDEAITWKSRLLATAAPGGTFAAYQWNFPQPEILPDNRATFFAEGTRTGGGPLP